MALLALVIVAGCSVGFAQPTLPPSTRHICYCRYHVNGQPIQETCIYLPTASFRDGARPLLPTEDRYCLPRDQFCATEPLGCPPAPAPIDHEAWNLTIVKCTDASTCVTPDALVTLTAIVDNVSYDMLAANESLYSAFQLAVSQAVAAEVGAGVSAQHVTVALSPGSVIITATVLPPSKVGALRAFLALNASVSLSETLYSAIVNIDGIESVISGDVKGDVKVNHVSLADLVPAQAPSPPPTPAPPPPEALFLDRFGSPVQALFPRERQELQVRCTPPCSEASTGLLDLSCDGVKFGEPASGTFISNGLWFVVILDTRLLITGMSYKLCVDLDGDGSAYEFKDSGLMAFISPAVHLFPSATLNLTETLNFRVTCDVGCGSTSTAYLGLSCATGDNDGYRAAVPKTGTESALLGRRHPHQVQTVWQQKDPIVSAKRTPGDRFGASVSLFGDFLAVGAPGVNTGEGVVFVFEHSREGSSLNPWTQVQTLSPPADFHDPLGRFGWSVAMGLSFLAVGAPHDERDTVTDATGTVFVFHFGYDSTWEVEQQLKGHLEKGWWLGRPDRFGWACALSGSQIEPILAVGAPEADDVVLDGGVVFIFERMVVSGKAKWTITQTLTAFEAGPYALFGASLSLSAEGALLAVGAPAADNGTATDAGQVFLFQRDSESEWFEAAQLQPEMSTPGGQFGTSVALGEGCLWVGEPGTGSGAGAVHVFIEGDDLFLNNWTLHQTFVGPSSSAELGTAVSAQDELAAATAPGEDGGVGAVYVWVRDSFYWSQQMRLQPVKFVAGEGFGRQTASEVLGVAGVPMSLNGGRVVCGAAYADGGPVSGFGAAHPFELLDGGAAFDLSLRIIGLQRGKRYKLCMDFDGYRTKLAFGNTGLEFMIGETTTTTTTTTRTTSTTSTSSATTTSSSTTSETTTSTTVTTTSSTTNTTTETTTTSSTQTRTTSTFTTQTSTSSTSTSSTTSATSSTTSSETTSSTTSSSTTSTTSSTTSNTTSTTTTTETASTTTSSSTFTANMTDATTTTTDGLSTTSSSGLQLNTSESTTTTDFSTTSSSTTLWNASLSTTTTETLMTTSSLDLWNSSTSTTSMDTSTSSAGLPLFNDVDATTTSGDGINDTANTSLNENNDTDTALLNESQESNVSSPNSSSAGSLNASDTNLSNDSNTSTENASSEEAAM